MSETAPVEPRELLEHAGWVRALARQLVRDPHVADDVTQEVLASAIRHPPKSRSNLRAWLAVSLRNALHSASRSTRRRHRRERVASRGERVPATVDLVERLDVHRRLVDEVQRLVEPYRTVILLRYFEGRSLAEIARSCEVPVPTVTSRLRRALDHLRARLDAVHGSREAWVGILVPFAWSAGAVPTEAVRGSISRIASTASRRSSSNAAFVSTASVGGLAVVTTVLLIVTYGMMQGSGPQSAASDASRSTVTSDRGGEVRESRDASLVSSSNGFVETEDGSLSPIHANAGVTIRGRVVDPQGAPVAQVEVGFVATRVVDRYPNSGLQESDRFVDERSESVTARRSRVLATARADALGRFEIAPPLSEGRVIVLEPELTTVLAGVVYDGSQAERVVVAAPARSITGYAVDDQGRAVVDASVSLRVPKDLRSSFGIALDESLTMSWTTQTGADGTFRIDYAPTVAGSSIDVTAIRHEPWTSPIEIADPAPYVVARLERSERRADLVHGCVVSPEGEPVPEAVVLCAGRQTRTDALGEFSLPAGDASADRRLQVLRKGWSAAVVDVRANEPWPDPLRVTLRGEPAVMRGRVVHADGRPASGAWVWLADPTIEEVIDGNPVAVEALLAGDEAPRLRWRIVAADGSGRFQLTGLLDRPYRVRASSENCLAIADVGPLRPDAADVEIVLPAADDVYPIVEGTVVDRHGAPVSGVVVSTSSVALAVADRASRGPGWRWFASGPSTRTDAAGHFRLENVPRQAESLQFRGDGVTPKSFAFDGRVAADLEVPVDGSRVEDLGDLEELAVVLSRCCHLRVVSHADADPDLVFELRDENDRLVPMEWKLGIGAKRLRECSLGRTASPALSVPDHACEIVYRIGETIVERTPIDLVAGEVTTVDYRGP